MDNSTILNDPLLELLVEQGHLTGEQMTDIAEEHTDSDKPVKNIVVDLGLLEEDQVLEIIAGIGFTNEELVELTGYKTSATTNGALIRALRPYI